MRQTRKFAQRPHHRVERVGYADDEGVGGVGLDAFADRLHHFQIYAEQVIAAHARLAGDPGGDDDDVGAGDVGGDAVPREGVRAGLREADEAGLRRGVVGLTGGTVDAGRAGEVDEPVATSTLGPPEE